jgi:ubiquinone/menaquinone biosynthesis C-methylase UbiE
MAEPDAYAITRETYEIIAARFAEEWDRPGVTDEAVSDFLEHLASGGLVLEVGAGSGRDARALAGGGHSVVATDISLQMIDQARRRGATTLLACDMRSLPFRTASFDALWACASFLHIRKVDALGTLEGFHRVLRDGGVLFVSVKLGTGEAWREGYERQRFYSFYSEAELDDLLGKAGFEVVTRRVVGDALGREPWIERVARRDGPNSS